MWPEVVDHALAHDRAVVAHALRDGVAQLHSRVPDVIERQPRVDEPLNPAHECLQAVMIEYMYKM